MSRTSRRNFVKSTTGGLAASFVITRDRRLLAANEQIQHAVIGTGGQGRTHCRAFSGLDRLCRVMAVCDVDEKHLKLALEMAGPDVKGYKDFREVLERSDIDIVVEFEKPIGFKFFEFAEYIEKLLGRKVEILTSEGIKGIRIKEVAVEIKRSLLYV